MPQVSIRPAVKEDMVHLVQVQHGYHSQYVWQMDRVMDEGQIMVQFRQMRLPRPMRVEEPGPHPLLDEANWSRYQALLLAELDGVPVGYVGLSDQMAPRTVWVTDCAVRENLRRRGIGAALLLAAQEWGFENGFRRIVLEIQPRNHPAIQLARKLNFEFSGYNDHYSGSQDIILFFARSLRA